MPLIGRMELHLKAFVGGACPHAFMRPRLQVNPTIPKVLSMKCRFTLDDVCFSSPCRCPLPEFGNTGRNGCSETFQS